MDFGFVQDSFQSHIGRYEVVGRLASGGMAEIFLARLTGPSGFERAVAIKRILPQYAENRAFVQMFLDEARIAARINHPNVVHYQELGEADEQLFLVMEYLEGESLSSIQRRARARRAPLPISLVMFIIAEAAAGLHAAHSMTNLDDVPLGIVHRDISPDNIFVTYQGGVKVMDFGIAKATDRITATEAGSLKGKFPYMSPEQASGLPLDSRSDIFSLGVVLYELATGHRLFRRATPAATLRAVQNVDVIPPSKLIDGFSSRLEVICMRALAEDPSLRYPSAEALRSALLLAVRQMAPESLPQQELREILADFFSDRVEQKREMLRRVSSGSALTKVPPAEVDHDIELPSIDVVLAGLNTNTPSRSKRWGLFIAALVTLLGATVAGLVFWSPDSSLNASATEVVTDPVAETATETATEPSDEPTPAMVQVIVVSLPSGAQVFVDGEPHAEPTPTTIEVPFATEALQVRLSLAGYDDLTTEIVPDVDSQRVRLPLERSAQTERVAPQRTPSMRRTPRVNIDPPSDPEPSDPEPPPFPVF